MSLETKTLLGLLEDGQWHPFREVADKLEATIAPGKALRRYDTRAANRETIEGPRKGPELSEAEKIASGRRTLANVAINSMKKRYVEIGVENDGRRMIRLRPEAVPSEPRKLDAPPPAELDPDAICDRCGAWMFHAEVHAQWHAENDPPPAAPPVLDQIAVVVRQEVQHVLDGYQKGMQAFLLDRFADLEIAVLRSKLPLGLRGGHRGPG